jgi:hypothetical protein
MAQIEMDSLEILIACAAWADSIAGARGFPLWVIRGSTESRLVTAQKWIQPEPDSRGAYPGALFFFSFDTGSCRRVKAGRRLELGGKTRGRPSRQP